MTTANHLPFELLMKIVKMAKLSRCVVKIQRLHRGYSTRKFYYHRKDPVWKNLFRLYPAETLEMERYSTVRFEWQHEIASWALLVEPKDQRDQRHCSRVIQMINHECKNGYWGKKTDWYQYIIWIFDMRFFTRLEIFFSNLFRQPRTKTKSFFWEIKIGSSHVY